MATTKGRQAPAKPAQSDTSPAREWQTQAKLGRRYRLPGSGLVAKLRKPGMVELITGAGHLPSDRVRTVQAFMAGKDSDAQTPQDRIATLKTSADAYAAFAELCFVEPRIVRDREPDYSAGEIALTDIPQQDLLWVYWTLITEDESVSAAYLVDNPGYWLFFPGGAPHDRSDA